MYIFAVRIAYVNFGTPHIKIFVYDNDHPPPHCHVVRADGTKTRVVLPTMTKLDGPPLSKVEYILVQKRLEKICEAYDKKNPKQH